MSYKAGDKDWGRVMIQSCLATWISALDLRACLGPPPLQTGDQSQRLDHLPLVSETQAGILQNSQLLTFLQPETKEETIFSSEKKKKKKHLCPRYGKTVDNEQMIFLKLTNPPHIN